MRRRCDDEPSGVRLGQRGFTRRDVASVDRLGQVLGQTVAVLPSREGGTAGQLRGRQERWFGHGIEHRTTSGWSAQGAEEGPDVVAEHIGPTIGVVTPLDAASCELVAGSDSLDEMALYVGLIGEEIVVHEPAELLEHMAALGARLVRATQWPSPRP